MSAAWPQRASFLCPVVVAVFIAGLLAGSGLARADEQSDLDKVRAAYLAHQYDDADLRLRSLLDPTHGTHDAAVITQARMYLGAVLLAKGKGEQAGAIFERLLLDDPQFEPDPLSFPTDVIDLFIDTRARLRDRLNAQAQERARFEAQARAREEEKKRREIERVAMLEKLAAEETVTSVHSRWLALVPFGVGQFQNGKKTLGWIFLASESALVLGTAVTVPLYLIDVQNRDSAYAAGDRSAATAYLSDAQTVRIVNLALVGGLAITAVAGIVEAELDYVPTVVESRPRSVPPLSWSMAPLVSPATEGRGGVLGIVGRF